MRQIQISTEVFAAIWKARREGEANENAILGRLLKVTPTKSPKVRKDAVGFRDARYGVEFAEGFKIFRTYLGKEHSATAVAGSWMLQDTGDMYPSLNELSRAIGAKTENAWVNWFYVDENGDRAPVSVLRDHSKIIRRKRAA
jgi:hypothetical protein